MYAVYTAEEKTSKGITLYRYSPDKKELQAAPGNPDNYGFCTPAKNCILGDGMMNLSTCQVCKFSRDCLIGWSSCSSLIETASLGGLAVVV